MKSRLNVIRLSLLALLLAGFVWFLWPVITNHLVYRPRVGDIVFQSLPLNPLVEAIEGITASRYSHCGLVDEIDGWWVVVESLGIVHATPLGEWMNRGDGSGVAVYRYGFAGAEATRVMVAAHAFDGRKYDIQYELDDEKIYCSELVYKAFSNGLQIKLGTLERLGDLHWQGYEKTIEHFAQGPPPLDRLMITPVSLTRDARLSLVYDSFPH